MRSVCLKEELGVLQLPVYKVEDGINSKVLRDIVVEYPLEFILNGKSINTFLCTQVNLKELVIGYSMCKGIIDSLEDIKYIEIDEVNRVARLDTFEEKFIENYKDICKFVDGDIFLDFSEIYNMMERNLTSSKLFKHTGGVHSVAVFDKDSEVVICEDVARHNAMDKAIGYCILNNIPLNDKVVVLSGRVSVEMMTKAALNKIPMVISKSAPTNLSIELADRLNITLVGFVRGKGMNIYTHPHRINTNI